MLFFIEVMRTQSFVLKLKLRLSRILTRLKTVIVIAKQFISGVLVIEYVDGTLCILVNGNGIIRLQTIYLVCNKSAISHNVSMCKLFFHFWTFCHLPM